MGRGDLEIQGPGEGRMRRAEQFWGSALDCEGWTGTEVLLNPVEGAANLWLGRLCPSKSLY